jgi:hypothetical protein
MESIGGTAAVQEIQFYVCRYQIPSESEMAASLSKYTERNVYTCLFLDRGFHIFLLNLVYVQL